MTSHMTFEARLARLHTELRKIVKAAMDEGEIERAGTALASLHTVELWLDSELAQANIGWAYPSLLVEWHGLIDEDVFGQVVAGPVVHIAVPPLEAGPVVHVAFGADEEPVAPDAEVLRAAWDAEDWNGDDDDDPDGFNDDGTPIDGGPEGGGIAPAPALSPEGEDDFDEDEDEDEGAAPAPALDPSPIDILEAVEAETRAVHEYQCDTLWQAEGFALRASVVEAACARRGWTKQQFWTAIRNDRWAKLPYLKYGNAPLPLGGEMTIRRNPAWNASRAKWAAAGILVPV